MLATSALLLNATTFSTIWELPEKLFSLGNLPSAASLQQGFHGESLWAFLDRCLLFLPLGVFWG